MIFRGKILKKSDEDKIEKILELVNSKKYMEAIDLLAKSMGQDDPLRSKAEEALEMIAGLALKEASVSPSTSEDYEKFRYNGSCIVKICTVINLSAPIRALGWYIKGAGAGGVGDYDEAIRCFDKTVEIQASGAIACDAWKDKAAALLSLQKYEAALECTDAALRALNVENAEGDIEKRKQGIRKLRERCEEKLSSSER
ncbi:MAG: hypothetical protein ACYTBJ_24870 [Planctomycetota bacterium]|jgi:tetratricopeptide (TPR) repeat protein